MDSHRRTFLKASAATTAAFTLSPLLTKAEATESAPDTLGRLNETDTAPLAFERRMVRAQPVPLERVRVTGGPLKQAQDLTATYLLSLEPDRMLAYYRVRAGLTQKAEPYTGWDGGGRNLTGHIAGHHLSGVSLMYKATGDARFRERADYIVRELDEVQRVNGDGYVGALEGLREAFAKVSKGEIKSGGFDLNGLWSPWYTLHKTYAGLRDAYRHTGSALALKVEIKFAAWAEQVLAPLTETQMQSMLNTEHGGMNEILADLYADTGDARWLALSRRFEHQAFTTPLKRHQDNLSGKHGNCQIPKLMGSAARYGYTGDMDDIVAASFFFDRVARHHSYASGGHGLNEYFGPPDKLSARVDGRAAETCNVYNMIKLSRRLFSLRPDGAYADFHERALFNHILASIDPTDGRTSYMVPVGRSEQQEYQDMLRDFTCCVGSGMESHALHGLGVYYESSDTVWVNLFVPSTAQCAVAKAQLTMDTNFPDGDSATIRVTVPTPKSFTLAVRRPVWAGDGFAIAVNGVALEQPKLSTLNDPVAGGRAGGIGNESEVVSSGYVSITRTWKSGDTVSVTLPKSLHLEPTADNPQVTAIMWGPLALAGEVGSRIGRTPENAQTTPRTEVPMLVSSSRQPGDFVVPAARSGDFRITGAPRRATDGAVAGDIALTPFYRTHRRRYSLYYDLLTPAEFESRVGEMAAARAAAARLVASTVGLVQVGDVASERDRNYQSDPKDRVVGRAERRTNRAGTGWFSYDLPVSATAPMALVVTYFVEPGLPAPLGNFDVLVDGTSVGHYAPNQAASAFYDAVYDVPAALTAGKGSVTVRLQAVGAGRIVPVYAIRMVVR
ncbi:MAG: glycoside hydrolase family 127 protein [Gemmatimonadaceae bacterium]|nr:glycoside hydrolase family 127 protein [Gemmatimonadaceae bacterium]